MRLPVAVALVAWAIFVAGASGAHFWLDSGELAAAGIDLGVQHPPGFPGYVLLLRIASVIPLGSLGFRLALVSCACAAVAVGGVVAILRRRDVDPWIAAVAGLWLALGWTFYRQARVVEVYSLAAALLVIVLAGLDPAVPGSRRTHARLSAVAAATWAAWCFGDLRLCLGPLLLLVWALDLRRARAWTRWAPVVAVAASWVVLAVPLASAGAPTMDWGDPDTPAALWDHLQARSIREAFADEILPASALRWWLATQACIVRLAEDLGAPGLALVPIAFVRAWWRGDRRVAAAMTWLVLVELVYAIGINPMGGADRQTTIPIAIAAVLVVAHELHAVIAARPRLRWAVVPLAAAVLVGPPALTSAADFATTRSWMPHAWTRAALANLPPGALVLTQSDDLAAGIAAAQLLEGARPDVITFPAQHLHKSFGEASAERPEIQRLRAAAAVAGTEAERIAAVIAAHPGAVAVERPGTALFASSPWYARGGAIPLRIGGPGAPTDAPTPPAEIERWLPEVESREDRRRLATALADLARGQFRLRGDVARAVAILELSLSQVEADHASALVSLAALRMGTGQRQAAEALLRRAIELEPGRVVAWMNLAGLLMDDPGRGDEAEAAAQRAVDLSPQRADAWQRLAQVRARRGDEAGAGAAQTEADARREASTRSPVIGDP